MTEKTLYERLGGYDGVSGFVDDLLPRLESDSQLGRFWQNRGMTASKERNNCWLIIYAQMRAGQCITPAGT